MALDTFKCNYLTPLQFKGLKTASEMLVRMTQMKKIARRQNEDAQGGEKNKKNVKSNMKPRKTDDSAGHC